MPENRGRGSSQRAISGSWRALVVSADRGKFQRTPMRAESRDARVLACRRPPSCVVGVARCCARGADPVCAHQPSVAALDHAEELVELEFHHPRCADRSAPCHSRSRRRPWRRSIPMRCASRIDKRGTLATLAGAAQKRRSAMAPTGRPVRMPRPEDVQAVVDPHRDACITNRGLQIGN